MPGFSELPKSIQVSAWSRAPGHLVVWPKSNRIEKIISQTNTEGLYILALVGDEKIQEFLNLLSESARLRDFTKGTSTVLVDTVSYVRLVVNSDPSNFSDKYNEYLSSVDAPRPRLFAVIDGTPIYHVHKYGCGKGREMSFWYSTAQYPEDLHEEYSFRVDELDPTCVANRIGDEPTIDAWNRFQEHCKRAIAQALRDNKLKLVPVPGAAVLGGNSAPPVTSAVLGAASRSQHAEHIQFCYDMGKAGIPIETKKQRAFWHGPVARCQDISQIMGKTQIPCLWDECGKHGFEVYPKAYSEASLREAIAKFDDPEFQASLAEQLRCSYPLKGIAQNLVDHLVPYFPDKIEVVKN